MTSKLFTNLFPPLILSSVTFRPSIFTTAPQFQSSYSKSSSSSLSSSAVDHSAALEILHLPITVSGPRINIVSPASSAIAAEAPAALQQCVVVYDGVCHLCHRGVKWVIKADKYRKIKFCCLQSKAAEPYLRYCGLDREDVSRSLLFVEANGFYSQASTAVLRVLSYLPPPYSALSALTIIPTHLRDAAYDHAAERCSKRIGRAEDCLVLQEKELLDRFIDRDELLDQDL